jgi:predicted nucleotidyltransferase
MKMKILEGLDKTSIKSVASFLSNKTGNDYSFLIKNAHLGDHICLIGLGGSLAYGTNTPESDLDVRGIAINSATEILTNQNFEQVLDNATDTTIYSFNKMVKLLTDCNPNTIEILGLLPEHYLYINEVGQYLLDHKDIFLSKRVINTFGGYANAQLRRLDNKAMRTVGQYEQEKHILHSIENASTTFPSRYFDYDSDSIRLYIDDSTQEDFDTEIFMDINLTHYPLRDWKGMWSEMSNIVKDYSKLGHRNNNAIARGKLGKHQMHLVRLYLMCIDILEKGEIITYRQKEHDFLMDIRNGKYLTEDNQPIPEFYDIVDELENRMNNAAEHTELPDKPRIKEINDLLFFVNRSTVMNEGF